MCVAPRRQRERTFATLPFYSVETLPTATDVCVDANCKTSKGLEGPDGHGRVSACVECRPSGPLRPAARCRRSWCKSAGCSRPTPGTPSPVATTTRGRLVVRWPAVFGACMVYKSVEVGTKGQIHCVSLKIQVALRGSDSAETDGLPAPKGPRKSRFAEACQDRAGFVPFCLNSHVC